jgi:hypothetical protein
MLNALKITLAIVCFLGLCGLVGAWLFAVLDVRPLPDDPNADRADDSP